MNQPGTGASMGTRDRVTLDSLPSAARAAIAAEIGEIRHLEPIATGLNSTFAAVLHTADAAVFVKGMPEGHPGVRSLRREAAIAPHTAGIAPRLRWHLNTAGWELLGFDHLPGRTADLSPDSPDLADLASTLARLGELEPPPLSLARIEQRWTGLADDADLALLAGERLLHTDLNPNNILISDGQARLVDWAWATLGAAWIDPACAALWLIAEGHTPAAAEAWAHTLPAWSRVPPNGLDIFVAVNARLWTDIATNDPRSWKLALRDTANQWRTHRSS